MASYTVTNTTKHTIWWKDGLWTSGDLRAGDTRTVDTDHDANVTVFEKIEGQDAEVGKAWINRDGHLTVHGRWDWSLKPQA